MIRQHTQQEVVIEEQEGLNAEAEGEVVVGIDATIAEERPPPTDLLGAMEVDIDKEVLGVSLRGFGKELALWTSYEAGTPELDAVCQPARIGLVPYPIDGDDGQAIGHGVTTLNNLPGLALTGLLLGRIAALIADSGGIDEDVGSSKGHEAGTFRIPLVPADLYAEATD